ncbi:arginine--tRNA ligase, chloroplastic/mitochondrial [Artemisia annua]|uniref:arginine--tRNA ligase n=1 Tax=Artemisia annua TaxID=35608 RepID=A0A2U1LSV8_ARTAN|nr:arginine--tRNA ligase, chloroplastic/mitochondrial [Artemisia annua]
MTPVRKQVYIEMCLAVAKHEGWIPSDRHKPPRTRYAGYQTCIFERRCLLFAERCVAVSKGEAARLLGYSVEAVSDCVLRYTTLMNHRLAVCTFDMQMFNKKENTFVYLLNTRAQIHRLTNDYRKDIDELKKASKLILEKDKGWETGEERVLGFHLLEFTEALEESCLSIMPHILCEYLYDLCKKFNRYHSSMCKDGFVVETSTLLLYEATEVVIEKCFHLLGILPGSSLFGYSMTQLVSGLLFSAVERPIDVYARDPTRNFRFEMVCFRSIPVTPLWLDHEGELFGLISVSDKIVPSRSHFFETDVTSHVPLFNHDWRNPIKNLDSNCVYLGNPASGYSVSFSYFIEICAELYVTNKNECYQLCNHKKEIDLSSFWENSDGVCGELTVNAKHGYATMYYILLKDAIDTALKVEFKTEPDTPPRLVRGYIQAYYGDEFLYKCQSGSICKECYMAVLFQAAPSYVLTAGYIPLIKSFLGVPTKGSLIIKAYLQDVDSNKVIIDGTSNFKPQLYGCNRGTITGSEDCSLNIEVSWNYQDRYI